MITYSNVVAKFYQSSVNPESWPDSLSDLARIVGGIAATMVALDSKGNIVQYVGGNIESTLKTEFEAYYKNISPRLKFFMENPNVKILYDNLHTEEETIDSDEYYRWMQSYGFRYYIGGRLAGKSLPDSFVAIHRSPIQGHVDKKTIALFSELNDHLERAFQISQRIQVQLHETETAWSVIESSPRGIVVLDAEFRVRHCNREARRILAEGDCIRLTLGRLEAVKHGENIRLQKLIGEAAAAAAARSQLHEIASILVERPASGAPIVASAAPSFSSLAEPTALRPGVVVFLRDPANENRQSVQTFTRLHGLTPSESRLVESLLSGQSLTNFANVEGISNETARWHLKNVFQKSGCHRQPELIALVHGTSRSSL